MSIGLIGTRESNRLVRKWTHLLKFLVEKCYLLHQEDHLTSQIFDFKNNKYSFQTNRQWFRSPQLIRGLPHCAGQKESEHPDWGYGLLFYCYFSQDIRVFFDLWWRQSWVSNPTWRPDIDCYILYLFHTLVHSDFYRCSYIDRSHQQHNKLLRRDTDFVTNICDALGKRPLFSMITWISNILT